MVKGKEESYKLVGEIRLLEKPKIPMERRELTVLKNGLIVCKVRIQNPYNNEDNAVECIALVDTGAEISLLDKRVYDGFRILTDKVVVVRGISTFNGNSDIMDSYPFNIQVPYDNMEIRSKRLYVKLLEDREYNMVLGMDILKDMDFIYSGIQERAWFEY